MKTAVIAVGGNSLWKKGQQGTFSEQEANARATAESIVPLLGERRLLLTHGNGPQVGAILMQNEYTEEVPGMPLDVCGAQSQGLIGYILQQQLQNALLRKGIDIAVTSLVTQVLVDVDDPAFSNPTKPVGPFMCEEEALVASRERGWSVVEVKGIGWRRVVPSPEPVSIVEKKVILAVLSQNEPAILITAGGGGIPVVETDGILKGVEGVIDKDLASKVLALEVGAEELLILTDEAAAFLDYGSPSRRRIENATATEMRKHLEDGQFPPGSMGPKVRAAVEFVENGGEMAVITNADSLEAALRGEAGTRVYPG